MQTTSGLHLKAVNMLNAVRLCLCFRFIIEMNGGQMFTNYRHDLLGEGLEISWEEDKRLIALECI